MECGDENPENQPEESRQSAQTMAVLVNRKQLVFPGRGVHHLNTEGTIEITQAHIASDKGDPPI